MNAIFKENNAVKVIITIKMDCYWCISLGENFDFPEFLQKSFIASTTGHTFY